MNTSRPSTFSDSTFFLLAPSLFPRKLSRAGLWWFWQKGHNTPSRGNDSFTLGIDILEFAFLSYISLILAPEWANETWGAAKPLLSETTGPFYSASSPLRLLHPPSLLSLFGITRDGEATVIFHTGTGISLGTTGASGWMGLVSFYLCITI